MLQRGKLTVCGGIHQDEEPQPFTFFCQGCSAAFSSIMGYVYHMRKCGKQESELEKLLLNCSHCGKPYKSKAGLGYHLKSEHAPVSPDTQHDSGTRRL